MNEESKVEGLTDSPDSAPVSQAAPEIAEGPRMPRKLLRSAFWLFWFVVLPLILAGVLVSLLTPKNGAEAQGAFAWLQNFVREQPVPCGILAFTLFEGAFWFARHKLPLSHFVLSDLPQSVSVEIRNQFEQAQSLLDEVDRILRKTKGIEAHRVKEISSAVAALRASMRQRPFDDRVFVAALDAALREVERQLGPYRKSEAREYIESIVFAVGIALFLRTTVFEAFKIPSGSMIPTLQVGDHIFVNKLSYGPQIPFTHSRLWTSMPPRRGDVMVFQFPEHPEQDFIKRVMAIPGDTLEAKNGHPYINGWEVPNCFVGIYTYSEDSSSKHQADLYVEYLEEQAFLTLYDHSGVLQPDVQGPYKVGPREAWVMGDNRHNSHDSRLWNGGQGGGVPYENIKGRALFVWLSMSQQGLDWTRIGAPVMGYPRMPPTMKHLEPGIKKCLRERPPLDKTYPPPGKGG